MEVTFTIPFDSLHALQNGTKIIDGENKIPSHVKADSVTSYINELAYSKESKKYGNQK